MERRPSFPDMDDVKNRMRQGFRLMIEDISDDIALIYEISRASRLEGPINLHQLHSVMDVLDFDQVHR